MDTLAELEEALAWAYYLDSKTSRAFEAWKRLWTMRQVAVPAGAWECA